MFFFWYCFDDWFAAVTNTPWAADVPWVVILLLHFIFAPLIKIESSKS